MAIGPAQEDSISTSASVGDRDRTAARSRPGAGATEPKGPRRTAPPPTTSRPSSVRRKYGDSSPCSIRGSVCNPSNAERASGGSLRVTPACTRSPTTPAGAPGAAPNALTAVTT